MIISVKHLTKYSVSAAFCLLVSSASTTLSVRRSAMDMLDAMNVRMEQQFSDMYERLQNMSSSNGTPDLDTYTRNAVISEDAAAVRVAVSVDKGVSVKDVIIDLENGVLHVLVEKPERVEIVVEEHWLTLTAERRSEGQNTSSASYASQQLTLPSVVDVSTVKADLTDGNLTLTFQKNSEKNKQRIQVTQGGLKQPEARKLKDK